LYATFGVDVVAALDAVTGDVKWKTNLNFAVRSKPVVHKDKIIVLTVENALIALNKNTGEISWQNPAIENDANLLAPVEATIVGDSLCYISSGEVVCDEVESGMNLWSSSFSKVPNKLRTEEGFYTDSNSVTHLNNKEIIASSSRGVISLINAGNADTKWLKNYTLSSKPTISGNVIAFIMKNSQLTLLDKSNGLEFWNADLKALNKDENSSPRWGRPLLLGNMVISISNEGQLAAFELETGKLLKEISVPTDITVQPEVINDKLILTVNNGYIYIY
jgi:outer membrane protein assembly factor BamB